MLGREAQPAQVHPRPESRGRMICPNPSCQSEEISAKRKFHEHEGERMQRYTGINCTVRKYKCPQCNLFFGSVEITEEDFMRVNGFKLAKQVG